jgi:hypothetical protein
MLSITPYFMVYVVAFHVTYALCIGSAAALCAPLLTALLFIDAVHVFFVM